MTKEHPFDADLRALGFRRVQERRGGDLQYSQQATRYLVYWVHWNSAEDHALFTWELDIGQFMHDQGLQIGANETLNLFLFPQADARGAATIDFVVAEIDRAEGVLRSLNFVDSQR
jgi:hypothetical protein